MTDSPAVAVLLAAYNGRRWLVEQIDAILAQQGVRPRVFISVDPSTDDTADYCRQRARDDERITLLPGEGPGSATGNFYRLIREVDAAAFDYIALSDQDDYWFADKLERAIARLGEHGARGYSSNVTALWPDGRRKLLRKAWPQRRWDFLFESPGPGCSFVLTPDLYRAVRENLLDPETGAADLRFHDVYIYAFARANGYPWVIDPESRILYRQHPDNALGANLGLAAMVFRFRYIVDGQGLEQSVRVADAVGIGDSAFVRRWRALDRPGLSFLLRNAGQCRRKPLHQVFFALIMGFMWLFRANAQRRTGTGDQ